VFQAIVHGTPDQRVNWSIAEGSAGGAIQPDGSYRSPSDRAGVYHVVATSVADPSATAFGIFETCVGDACGTRFTDAGGPVIPSSVTYALFWGDPSAFPADARSGIETLFRGLDGSAHLALADQYMRGARTKTRFGGTLEDHSEPPEGVAAVGGEICRILDANGIEPRTDGIYFLFTSSGPAASSRFCAWHSSGVCNGVPIQTAYMPNPEKDGCVWPLDLGCSATSAVTRSWQTFAAHELFETMTDRGPASAWIGTAGEIGDPCQAFQACVPLSDGRSVQIQPEFSNAANACMVR
jgi:hypothetical protein